MINSAAMSAFAVVKSMIVIVLCAVLGGSVMVSCSGIEDEPSTVKPCENCNNKPEQPDVTVKEIHHDGCDVLSINWTAKNAVMTKSSLRSSEYSVDASDGGVFASVKMQYNANVEYSDGSFEQQKPTYSINNAVVGFGYAKTLVVKKGGISAFENDPEISTENTTNGKVTFLKWDSKTIAFLANSTFSVKSLTIAGQNKTDLCENGISYKFSHVEKIADGDSINKFNMYNIRIHGTATVADGNENTQNFYIVLRVAEMKDGGIVPPTPDEPEVVGYDVINQKVNGNKFTGDLVEIWSDGTNENKGQISFSYNSSDITPNNIEKEVTSLSYNKLDPTYGSNIRTGNNRSLNQLGCSIELTEMKNTVSMNTNRGSLVFGRTFEWAVLTAPNGDQIELKGMDAAINAGSVSDGGVQGDRLVITMTATGNSAMSATLTLKKIGGDEPQPGDKVQNGAYAKNQHIEGSWIKWTLVRTYSNGAEEEIPLSIAHKYNLSTESRKATQNRTYSATQGSMNLVSSENFSDDNYAGTFKKYTRNFSYADFNNTISAEGRDYITYNDNGFEMVVWNVSLSIEKQGVTLNPTNSSNDANWEKYVDSINYTLFAGNAGAADGSQEVEYSKAVTPVDPTPEDKVTEDIVEGRIEGGKWYYTYTVTHSVNTELNSSEEGYVDIVSAINVTPVNGWTCKANEAGFSLTGNTNQAYSNAGDYTFASNRGNNTVYASVQTSYVVSKGNVTKTLSGTASVVASASRVSSTETSNTYAVNGELYLNGVLVNSASGNVVETIEANQPVEPTIPDLGIVAVYSTISCATTGLSNPVYVAVYNNGNAVAKDASGNEICRGANPGLTPTVLAGALASVSQNGNRWDYVGSAGTAHFMLQDFTYTATGSPILNCAVSVNEDGTWTATNGTSTVTFGAY